MHLGISPDVVLEGRLFTNETWEEKFTTAIRLAIHVNVYELDREKREVIYKFMESLEDDIHWIFTSGLSFLSSLTEGVPLIHSSEEPQKVIYAYLLDPRYEGTTLNKRTYELSKRANKNIYSPKKIAEVL